MYYDERAGTTYAVAEHRLNEPNYQATYQEGFYIQDAFGGQGPSSFYWVEAFFATSQGNYSTTAAC
jgi:hypothetical protein